MQINRRPEDDRKTVKQLIGLAYALGMKGEMSELDLITAAVSRIGEDNAVERLAGDPRDQAAEYLLQLRRFVKKNEIPRDLASRVRKLGEEIGELSEALINGDLSAILTETGDSINVLVDMLMINWGDGPRASVGVYPFLIENLKAKAAKYDQGEQRLGDRA
jgi:NTP pyrophosphatase (non-canonical NTP hydrolase)